MTLPRPYTVPLLLAAWLAAAAGCALARAESPLPDPVPPAVLGRPLDQIRPARHGATKPRPAVAQSHSASPQASARAATARMGAAAQAAPAARQGLVMPTVEQQAGFVQRPPKQALDDRADSHTQATQVGQGSHFARKPLGPGVYFDDKDRAAVRKYYEAHPAAGGPLPWQVGAALPAGASVAEVPKAVLASLPKLPPGHRYLQAGGDILLVATGSGMVVDGISTRVAAR